MINKGKELICAIILSPKYLNINSMLKKILFALFILASFSAYSQFSNSISASQLPASGGMILDVVDYNNDGFEDVVYQSGLTGNIELYRNSNGVFTNANPSANFPVITSSGNGNEGVISFDYNNDGFQDILLVVSGTSGEMRLFKNNCGVNFVEVTTPANLPTSISLVAQYLTNDPIVLITDFDKDKDNDIVFCRKNTSNDYEVSILNNLGGSFSNPISLVTGFGSTITPNIAIINFDNDFDEDLLVIRNTGNSDACQIDLYENNGSGIFTVPSTPTGLSNSSPIGFANIFDINSDGYDDILLGTKEVVGSGPGNLGLKAFINNVGDGSFTTIANFNTQNVLGDYYQSHTLDLDNDGNTDILWEVNRSSATSIPNVQRYVNPFVYNNVRTSTIPSADTTSGAPVKYVVFDYNNDGKTDVFVPGTAASDAQLLRNNNTSNYIGLKFFSCNGQADPIGTRVMVKAGTTRQFKTYNGMGVSSTTTGKSERLNFGIGSNTVIDSIVVFWPIGNVDILTNINGNQNLTLYDGTCKIGTALVFDLGPDTMNFCNQNSGTVTAPAGFASYSWSTGSSTADITTSSEGWYFCTGTTVDGCFATDSVFVMFGKAGIYQKDTIMCLGASMRLDAYPRYDCSPLGAPAKRNVKSGDDLGPNLKFVATFNGHHYYVFRTASTWTKAETDALAVGGHLAVVNDVLENDFIQNDPNLANTNLWLGLYRTGGVGTPYVWVNCDTLTYTNWSNATNSPTNGANENYVYFRGVSSCADIAQWKNTDENASLADPCESNIFGLVEIDPLYNVSYLWSNGDTNVFTTVTPLTSNIHSVQVFQRGSSCIGSINIEIRDPNNLFPSDTLSECKLAFMQLQGPADMLSYKWNTGSTNQNIFVSTSGSNRWYILTVKTPEGCDGKDSVFVQLFNATIKTPDTTVCLGSQVYLRGPTPNYQYQTDYTQNFQTVPFLEFSSNNSITYNGSKTLGPFANDSISFNLTVLPPHDSIRVTFDLYIHDTWEGDCSVVGSDKFRFKNGNTNVLNTTFSNSPSCTQKYSSDGVTGSYPAFHDATTAGLPRRCDINGVTTKYTITKSFRHLSSVLNLSWVGELVDTVDNTTLCDESWTLDNIVVEVRRGGYLLWSTGDTIQNIFVNPTAPVTEYWVEVPFGNTVCYDTVQITTTTGKLTDDVFTTDTLRYCSAPGTPVFLNLPLNFDKYTWSNGDFNRTTNVYNEGWYTGYVETVTGCYNYDSIYVTYGGIKINPNMDTTICAGSPITVRANLKNDCSPFGGPLNTGYVPAQPIAGYTYKGEYRGKHYYLADVTTTWSLAAQNALNAGGHLACVNDTNEQKYLEAVIDSNAWLGAYNGPNGYFVWMNCDTITYTNWASAEPGASPDNYVFMRSRSCPEGLKWDANPDDDQANADPCMRNIYGLLEIAPYQYVFDWWINSISTYYTDSITINPTGPTRVFGLVTKTPGAPNCGIGAININIITEGFDIIKDSITKISCEGDTVMIEALPGYSNYLWDNGETTRIAVYNNRIGYAYCSYDNGTCVFTDSVYLNVPGKLTATPVVTDITCFGADDGIGNAAFINGTPPYNIQWIHNGSTNPIETNLSPGVYYYFVTDSNGCVASDSVTITNPPSPLTLSFVELNGIRCYGDTTAVIVPIPTGGSSPYTGNWVGYVAPDTLWYKGAGIYTYTVTDIRGCTISVDDTLTHPSELDITAIIKKQIFCSEDSNGLVILGATGGISPYNFTWKGNPITGDSINNVYNGLTFAYVMDANSCIDSAAINMVASNPEKCGLIVPSGFTPNGDGINDLFYIKGLGDYPDNELTIFNRWGETVYQTSNYKNDWNGKPTKNTLLGGNDGIVPNDTYFYILTTKANNKTVSGYVYITK
jgi:gliding motility-associated-like protein